MHEKYIKCFYCDTEAISRLHLAVLLIYSTPLFLKNQPPSAAQTHGTRQRQRGWDIRHSKG